MTNKFNGIKILCNSYIDHSFRCSIGEQDELIQSYREAIIYMCDGNKTIESYAWSQFKNATRIALYHRYSWIVYPQKGDL